MAGRLDYEVDRGAQLEDVLTWRDDADAAIDLTGYEGWLTVGSSDADPEPLLEKELIIGEEAGTVLFAITDEETAAMPARAYQYSVRLTSPEGVTRYLTSGLIHILGKV